MFNKNRGFDRAAHCPMSRRFYLAFLTFNKHPRPTPTSHFFMCGTILCFFSSCGTERHNAKPVLEIHVVYLPSLWKHQRQMDWPARNQPPGYLLFFVVVCVLSPLFCRFVISPAVMFLLLQVEMGQKVPPHQTGIFPTPFLISGLVWSPSLLFTFGRMLLLMMLSLVPKWTSKTYFPLPAKVDNINFKTLDHPIPCG